MNRQLILAFVVASIPARLHAATAILSPVADTTLLRINPNNNLGGEPTLVSGGTADALTNRALLKFDIAGAVPDNATIQSLTLTLTVVKVNPNQPPPPSPFRLHRLLRDWGEGTGASSGS